MIGQWSCGEDECSNIVVDERVKLEELPIEGTGEYDDEFGLEITEWTSERESITVAICAACYERERELIVQLEALSRSEDQ